MFTTYLNLMYQLKKSLFFLTLIICFLPLAKGQDTVSHCSCSSRKHFAPIGVMLDHGHSKGEWMISYRYMKSLMHGNLTGVNEVNNGDPYQGYLMIPDKMKMQMHMVMVMYGLSDKITLMGMVNYVSNSMDMTMKMNGQSQMGAMTMAMTEDEMHEVTRTNGLGDIKIYGLYKLLNNENYQISLNTGISLPTGGISRSGNSPMAGDRRYSYSMQTGTGSFSVIPGITYTGNNAEISWGSQVYSDFKTGKNKAGYKWGNELVLTSWLSRNWNKWLSNSLRIEGRATGKIKGFDPNIAGYRLIDPDADVNNSGGQRVSAYAGIGFVIPKGILSGNRLAVEYGLPVYQNLYGVQVKAKAIINAGWQYSF
jgi:hypothetical protein